MSHNSCISIRLGQVAPDKPLATHIQAEASMFIIQRKKCVFVSGMGGGGWGGGREGVGRKGAGGYRGEEEGIGFFFTSLPQSSMQIQITF